MRLSHVVSATALALGATAGIAAAATSATEAETRPSNATARAYQAQPATAPNGLIVAVHTRADGVREIIFKGRPLPEYCYVRTLPTPPAPIELGILRGQRPARPAGCDIYPLRYATR